MYSTVHYAQQSVVYTTGMLATLDGVMHDGVCCECHLGCNVPQQSGLNLTFFRGPRLFSDSLYRQNFE